MFVLQLVHLRESYLQDQEFHLSEYLYFSGAQQLASICHRTAINLAEALMISIIVNGDGLMIFISPL